MRANNNGEQFSYYPYGEERTSTVDGRDKFGTYFRDSATQDYAMARYYGAGTGRFWGADPAGLGSVHRKSPLSWNRFTYTFGDPINRFDPLGLDEIAPAGCGEYEYCVCAPDDEECLEESDPYLSDISGYYDKNGNLTINDTRVTTITTVTVSASVTNSSPDVATYTTMTTSLQLSVLGPYILPTPVSTLPQDLTNGGPYVVQTPPPSPQPTRRMSALLCFGAPSALSFIMHAETPNNPVGGGNAVLRPNPNQTNYGRGKKLRVTATCLWTMSQTGSLSLLIIIRPCWHVSGLLRIDERMEN